MTKRTKIVATLGPASDSPETISALIEAGVNVFRLNFSHGTHDTHAELVRRIRSVAESIGAHVGILGDLCGPKLRVGSFPKGPVTLATGQSFFLSENPDEPGDERGVGTSYPFLSKDLQVGNRVLLDDGNICLRVTAVEPDRVQTSVEDGGVLKAHKGLNIPGVNLSVATITDKDRDDLAFILEHQLDFVALSFVRRADDLRQLRDLIGENTIRIIAKIEKPEAIADLEGILDETDGIMIARGDLGVEMPIEQVPALQKYILTRCTRRGIPVITATQMLESMMSNQRPTRAETTDVFNAIIDGTDAVMLSGETAAGAYPVEAVRIMSAIAQEAEKTATDEETFTHLLPEVDREIEEILAHSACEAAVDIEARAIVAFTYSGNTAHNISKYHPPIPLYALSPLPETCRRLSLSWGVRSLLVERQTDTDAMIHMVEDTFKKQGLAETGDILAIVAGVPLGVKGNTNLLKLHRVS